MGIESFARKHFRFREIYRDGGENVYLRRFFVCPKGPRKGEAEGFPLGIKIHQILESDEEEAFHDHPWGFLSIILKGGYYEERPVRNNSQGYITGIEGRWRGRGSILYRKPEDLHRLTLDGPAWTFVICGKRKRDWGFVPFAGDFKLWVPWKQFTEYKGHYGDT